MGLRGPISTQRATVAGETSMPESNLARLGGVRDRDAARGADDSGESGSGTISGRGGTARIWSDSSLSELGLVQACGEPQRREIQAL